METPTPSLPQTVRDARQLRLLYILIALVTVTALALVVLWIVSQSGGKNISLPAGPAPAAVSQAQLEKLASQTNHPVYWAGTKSVAYELTRTTDGRIYVRYLPSVDKVGDPNAKYLTVGTYPEKNAFRSIQRAAHRPGAVSVKLADDGLLVFNAATPKSVYFGYPGANYQVEVFDPSAEEARSLVLNGTVKPIP